MSKLHSLPTIIKVGDRTYELFGFLKRDEKNIVGHEMVKRAVEMNAHCGQDDGQYLLDHQEDIPQNLRGKIYFVFTNWSRPYSFDEVCYIHWKDGRWVGDWWLTWTGQWDSDGQVLRRIE